MGKFQNQYERLELELKTKVKALIAKRGVESKYSNEQVLVISENFQFNVGDRGFYIVEISANNLIDKNGMTYYFSAISMEQLCELVDNL
jgi:hypothetical protein